MAFTQADIDKLNAATGAEKTVKFADGREVTYRTAQELAEIQARMQAVVPPTSGKKRTRQIRLYSDGGF